MEEDILSLSCFSQEIDDSKKSSIQRMVFELQVEHIHHAITWADS